MNQQQKNDGHPMMKNILTQMITENTNCSERKHSLLHG